MGRLHTAVLLCLCAAAAASVGLVHSGDDGGLPQSVLQKMDSIGKRQLEPPKDTGHGADVGDAVQHGRRKRGMGDIDTVIAGWNGCLRPGILASHGCWCGDYAGISNNRCTYIKDSIDRCCYRHDMCYHGLGNGRNARCDANFTACLLFTPC